MVFLLVFGVAFAQFAQFALFFSFLALSLPAQMGRAKRGRLLYASFISNSNYVNLQRTAIARFDLRYRISIFLHVQSSIFSPFPPSETQSEHMISDHTIFTSHNYITPGRADVISNNSSFRRREKFWNSGDT